MAEDVNRSPPAAERVITEEEDVEVTDETLEKVACEEVPDWALALPLPVPVVLAC